MTLNDDVLCGVRFLEIRINLYSIYGEWERVDTGMEFEVGSHHPEPETDVEHAQACGGHPIEEETGGFAHCGSGDNGMLMPVLVGRADKIGGRRTKRMTVQRTRQTTY